MVNVEDSCSMCAYCIYVKTKQYDCCDVDLYQCEVNDNIMDEFHSCYKTCDKFTEKE